MNRTPKTIHVAVIIAIGALVVAGCGSKDVELAKDAAGDGDGDGDGDGLPDGGSFGGPCMPGAAECNNCEDDDGDGLVDGNDPECTGAADDREDSFATGIPGDNSDAVKQDCFYDGNSGSGANDPCDVHVCCLVAPDPDDCDALDLGGPPFNPATCDEAIAACSEGDCVDLTPPGCDCFGCCTVCGQENGSDACLDIYTGPSLYPKECYDGNPDNDPEDCCTADKLENCATCDLAESCSPGSCNDDPNDCILCPGQTDEDLPNTCNMENECSYCSTGTPSDCECNTSSDCADLGDNYYCSAGCCITAIVD